MCGGVASSPGLVVGGVRLVVQAAPAVQSLKGLRDTFPVLSQRHTSRQTRDKTTDGRTDGRTNRQTDGRTDRRTNEQTDGQTDGQRQRGRLEDKRRRQTRDWLKSLSSNRVSSPRPLASGSPKAIFSLMSRSPGKSTPLLSEFKVQFKVRVAMQMQYFSTKQRTAIKSRCNIVSQVTTV